MFGCTVLTRVIKIKSLEHHLNASTEFVKTKHFYHHYWCKLFNFVRDLKSADCAVKQKTRTWSGFFYMLQDY